MFCTFFVAVFIKRSPEKDVIANGVVLNPGFLRSIRYTTISREIKPRVRTRGNEVQFPYQIMVRNT